MFSIREFLAYWPIISERCAMNRVQRAVRNFFGFSETETNGFLILLPLLAAALFSAPMYRWYRQRHSPSPLAEYLRADSLIAAGAPVPRNAEPLAVTPVLFSFDPNTASEASLTALGISRRTAARIVHYREKGGTFRTKKDFRKIYGLDSTTIRRLDRFLLLPDSLTPRVYRRDTLRARKPPAPFDLNSADSVQLMSVYGIGPALSRRILRYRGRLGGFISMTQVSEVYGIDSAAAQQLSQKSFIASGFQPRQINLNTAQRKELVALPYISYPLANAITAWRFQHGNFKTVEELTKIVILSDTIFKKIKPYLTVNE